MSNIEGLSEEKKSNLIEISNCPNCNQKFGRCIKRGDKYECICGEGYQGDNCDKEPPTEIIPTRDDWLRNFYSNEQLKDKNDNKNTISYQKHEHSEHIENKEFVNELKELNEEVGSLLIKIKNKNKNTSNKRRFLPSEFLKWAEKMPGLLGKKYDDRQHPKPIDVNINVDDKRKIHFRGTEKNPPKDINSPLKIIGSEKSNVDGIRPSNSDQY